MEQTKAYNLTEEDCRNMRFGDLVSIEVELYLKSDKKKWDKEYLLNAILKDYEQKNTLKLHMTGKLVDNK